MDPTVTVFIPTTRVTIQRGTATDSYGDEIDSGQVHATGVPVVITEVQQRSFLPDEQRGGVTEQHIIRFRPAVDIREGDRVLDEHTGALYVITDVTTPPSVTGLADIRTTATRIAARSLSS